MRLAKGMALGLLAAGLAGGCLGAVRPGGQTSNPSPAAPSSVPLHAGLCADLAAAYAERAALGDAYQSAIAGDLGSAQSKAAAIKARMAALRDGLPTLPLASADSSLRDQVDNTAHLMSGAADALDPPSGRPDPLEALPNGQGLLRLMDSVLGAGGPGAVTGCPGVAYAAPAVSFPAAPGGPAFGLPDEAGGWALQPMVLSGGLYDDTLRALGVDPAAVRVVKVDMTRGGQWQGFDVLDGVSARPERILAALPAVDLDGVSGRTASRTVNGFAVVRRGDTGLGDLVVTVAVRGDRAVVFDDVPDDALVDAVLEGTTR
jgi:hypothetical protein